MTTLRTISQTIFGLSLLVFAGLPTAGCLATDIDEEGYADDDAVAEAEQEVVGGTSYSCSLQVNQDCSYLNMIKYRGQVNTFYCCTCALGDSNSGTIWGTDTYTDDSSLCRAAKHSLNMSSGPIKVYVKPGQSSYTGTLRNGIQSVSYSSWPGSITLAPY